MNQLNWKSEMDMNREVWEGWTVKNYIEYMSAEISLIMDGVSFWHEPFKTAKEMTDYIVDHQPYYKKPIPEVNSYCRAPAK